MNRAKELYDEVHDIMKEEFSQRVPNYTQGPIIPMVWYGTDELDEYNEVYPGIYIGKGTTARDVEKLKELGITHVLNAAHGLQFAQINTDADMYTTVGMEFLGVPASDMISYDMSQHFDQANTFIKTAIENDGRVYCHCHQGRSRSVALVLAYLMMSRELTLPDALRQIREKRKVTPNAGFLEQLCKLQLDITDRKS